MSLEYRKVSDEASPIKSRFGHWKTDDCGRPSVAFTYNPTNIDIAYPQFFSGVVWLPSVEANAKVFLGESQITHNSVRILHLEGFEAYI